MERGGVERGGVEIGGEGGRREEKMEERGAARRDGGEGGVKGESDNHLYMLAQKLSYISLQIRERL